MPTHTEAEKAKNRAQNRSRRLATLRKKLGAQFTEKEGKALQKAEAAASRRKPKKTVSGLARNAARRPRKRK